MSNWFDWIFRRLLLLLLLRLFQSLLVRRQKRMEKWLRFRCAHMKLIEKKQNAKIELQQKMALGCIDCRAEAMPTILFFVNFFFISLRAYYFLLNRLDFFFVCVFWWWLQSFIFLCKSAISECVCFKHLNRMACRFSRCFLTSFSWMFNNFFGLFVRYHYY